MFKKKAAALACVVVLVSNILTSTTYGAELPPSKTPQLGIDVVVDGKKVSFPDTEPFLDQNDRIMVPIRLVSEKLGAKVFWDNTTEIVTITQENKNIVMPINSNKVTVNNETIELDTAAILHEGRVVVPLRFVSETLDTKVEWNKNAFSVTIGSNSFLAKVEAGEIKLDAWGRQLRRANATNLPKTADDWYLLEDIPNWAYDLKNPIALGKLDYLPSKKIPESWNWTKENLDRMALNVKTVYKTALNIDYRTIDKQQFFNSYFENLGHNGYLKQMLWDGFVDFVKENKIITEGYAFPEQSTAFYASEQPMMRVKFKFRVIQSNDMTQFSMDSYKPSRLSESPTWVKKGRWYEGYCSIMFFTNYGNYQEEHYKTWSPENMFIKDSYMYMELK